MRCKTLLIGLFMLSLTACANAGGYDYGSHTDNYAASGTDEAHMQPPAGFTQVSKISALPEFIPGLGSLYVRPDTLPAGPFLAYDRDGKFVATIYMIPLADMNAHKKFSQLSALGADTVAVDMYYNAGHPGVQEPHYHIVLWHVPADQAKLK